MPRLPPTAPHDLRRHWRVSEDVLLPLDASMRPLVGNSAWGYMLSRYAAPVRTANLYAQVTRRRHRGSARGQTQERAAGKFHDPFFLPGFIRSPRRRGRAGLPARRDRVPWRS